MQKYFLKDLKYLKFIAEFYLFKQTNTTTFVLINQQLLHLMQNKLILPLIVISQFCCTSLWFASNAVMGDLVNDLQLEPSALGSLTSVVQLGFIFGTLVFALFTITDRFSPSKVFFVSAFLGGLFNLGIIWDGHSLLSIMSIRFFTGFFLSGIYPVGMKIAADYYEKGLGKSLSFLVGALVLGTAFPHLLKVLTHSFPWQYVIVATSFLAITGAFLMLLFAADGPFRKSSSQFNSKAILIIFRNKTFKSSAFGYFGHMWELYTFWAFVPIMLSAYSSNHQLNINVPLFSFLIIGVGSIACVIGGYLSNKYGVKKIAQWSLFLSCICCLISPILFQSPSAPLFLLFLFLWGMFVIADSPLFSTLVAQNAPAELKGTALTIVNCLGFSITIISIQLISVLQELITPTYLFTFLSIGPIIGLLFLQKNK